MSITKFSTGVARDNALAGNVSFSASDMEWISTIRVGAGGAASVTFSAIPQEYKHLQIRWIARDTSAGTGSSDILVRLNSDSGANYTRHGLYGTGASAFSYANTGQSGIVLIDSCVAGSGLASTFGVAVVNLLDYTSSSKNKVGRGLCGDDRNGAGIISISSGLWVNTTPVTIVTILSPSGNLAQYTKVSLYGIRG